MLLQEGQDRADFEILIGLTRAAALDRQGRHAEAWGSLVEANRREFPRHQQAHRRNVQRMDAAYRAALGEGRPVAGPAAQDHPMSLFIVGPSRAGKSTLERLVGGLDGVKRGFESRLVEPAARRTSQLAGLLTVVDPVELPISLDAQFRKTYLEDLGEFAPGARIVTDTHPGMITAIGRIAATIPNVRFIFMRRDPQDLALRILMRRYRTGNHYAYDLATIFEHLSRYDQLMDLWVQRFPRLAIALTYEDLVTEPKARLRVWRSFAERPCPPDPFRLSATTATARSPIGSSWRSPGHSPAAGHKVGPACCYPQRDAKTTWAARCSATTETVRPTANYSRSSRKCGRSPSTPKAGSPVGGPDSMPAPSDSRAVAAQSDDPCLFAPGECQ